MSDLDDLDRAKWAEEEHQDEINRLRARVAELEADDKDHFALIEKQGDLLRAIGVAIKGPPPYLTLWSHHDLPELAAALRAENARLHSALEEAPEPERIHRVSNGIVGEAWSEVGPPLDKSYHDWFTTTRAKALGQTP